MANFNRVILAGNLTRDPQLSFTPANTPVCKFGMAINRVWTDRQTNEKREETCFVDCRIYGKQAETFNQYMAKGRPVLVEGRLQFDTWEAQDGSRRSKHRINVQNFQFIGGRAPGGAAPQQQQQAPQQQAPPPQEAQDSDNPPEPPADDIPF